MRLLLELSRGFTALADLDVLLPRVNDRIREVLGAESCAILLLDASAGELYFPVTSDVRPDIEDRLREIRVPVDRSVAGWVLRHGESTIVDDVSRDARFYPGADRESGARTRNLLYAPLRTRSGILGVIGVRNKLGGAFTPEDLDFLDALSGSVAVAVENARLWSELRSSEERLRAEVGALRRDLARHDRFDEIVGTGEAMAEVFRLMESAAATSIPVLLQGETGTGKELVARALHRESTRAGGPFLAVNCAAVPESLLESELFGHRRGAFTGADRDQRGLFEAACGGTIFLDEIGEMPASMQAKLLRTLQENEIVPVGERRPRRIDVRVISATNRDLEVEVRERRFRQDLYYRIAAFPIALPPLRERPEDVPLLVDRILAETARRSGKRVKAVEPEALEKLTGWTWPGNVRELRNEIERAVALAREGEAVSLAHLSPRVRGHTAGAAARSVTAERVAGAGAADSRAAGLRDGKARYEARYIAEVLRQHGGNVTQAARALGMSRVTLYKKIRDYGLRTAD